MQLLSSESNGEHINCNPNLCESAAAFSKSHYILLNPSRDAQNAICNGAGKRQYEAIHVYREIGKTVQKACHPLRSCSGSASHLEIFRYTRNPSAAVAFVITRARAASIVRIFFPFSNDE